MKTLILNDLGISLEILSVEYKKQFDTDKESRYVFKCKLKKGKKSFIFNFGQLIQNGDIEPTLDVILSLVQFDNSLTHFFESFNFDLFNIFEIRNRIEYNDMLKICTIGELKKISKIMN